MGTTALTEATVKYIEENTKTSVVRYNVRTDSDIIEFLAGKTMSPDDCLPYRA